MSTTAVSEVAPDIAAPAVVSTAIESKGDGGAIAAVAFLVIGLVSVLSGLGTAFSDTSRFVGGDAYNLIITGLRGLAFIGAGLALCGVAIVCAIFSAARRNAWLSHLSRKRT